jgi:3-phenylpropionate/trans-cinnamate dioxygenase ferredoxin reductase component
MSALETIVVVGGGQAGGWAARTLRSEGFAGRMVLIAEEQHPPYERPPLSKAVLAGEAAPETTHLFKPGALKELGLHWRRGERAAAIDRDAKRVVLGHGELIDYDKLILCTGGRPRWPAVPGADLPGVFALRTIEDSLAIGRALAEVKRLVVVGGGWIGLEVAATARKKDVAVTVLEARPRLCERTVPSQVSEYLLALHRKHGTEVILGCGLVGFASAPGRALSAQLDDGRTLEADIAVVGVGLVANDELARAAGLACENGVLVDDRCRTSDPDILAAGDVAIGPNRWIGQRIRLESWQNAQDQAIVAAKVALGHDARHDPLPWFWSDQYDMNLQIYGLPAPSQRAVIRGDMSSGSFLVFYLDEDHVQAAVGVNAARELRFARRLIEQRKSVRDTDLAHAGTALATL